jgi:hypothetical protein
LKLRQNVFDYAILEDSKIVSEDDKSIVVKAIIASEIVQQYKDGYAYKPADELEKAAWTAEGRWVKALSHPSGPQINSISDIHGRMENPRFRKDLNDPKTNRPCRRGIEVDLRFFKDRVKPEVLQKIKNGELKDNSIGFSCDKDPTPGEFQGQHYDYVQRNICIDHLAAPIEKGRCPSPYCGINVDSAEQDVWEENPDTIRSGHGDKNSFDPDSFRTIDITTGIKAVVGCPKGQFAGGKCAVGTQVQSFLFDKSKFDMAQAKAWFAKHQKDSSENLKAFYDCPVCKKIDELGVLETGKRLIKVYSAADALLALSDSPPTDKELQAERSSKYGIGVKEGGNVTKPTEHSSISDGEFADPVNYRYPIDESHVMAAWAYWNKPANQTQYNAEEKTKITDKIKAAMKKGGHAVADEQDGKDDVIQKNRQALQDINVLLNIF